MGLLAVCPTWQTTHLAYRSVGAGSASQWRTFPLDRRSVSDAFIGAMASLMGHMDNTGSQLPTDIEDAYYTVELVEAACESIDRGTGIAITVS